MITAIIIDDEPHCIDTLTQLIKKHAGNAIRVLPGVNNIEAGRKMIEEMQPELVFLDIEIGDTTGFDLLKQLPEIDFDIIFTTGYEKYAIQAIKLSALDYLLKPIDPDDLKQAIEKLNLTHSRNKMNKRYEILLSNLSHPQKRLVIPTGSGCEFVEVPDIIYCEGVNSYTHLHFAEKHKIISTNTLKYFDEQLEEYGFYRVHKSYLVNLTYVKNYNREGFVQMKDGLKLKISLRQKKEFIDMIKKQK